MIVELLSIILVILIVVLKRRLFPKLQHRVVLIDLVLVLWICNTDVRGLVLLVSSPIMLFFDILKIAQDVMNDIIELSVYKKTQNIRRKLLKEITLDEDEDHKNS